MLRNLFREDVLKQTLLDDDSIFICTQSTRNFVQKLGVCFLPD